MSHYDDTGFKTVIDRKHQQKLDRIQEQEDKELRAVLLRLRPLMYSEDMHISEVRATLRKIAPKELAAAAANKKKLIEAAAPKGEPVKQVVKPVRARDAYGEYIEESDASDGDDYIDPRDAAKAAKASAKAAQDAAKAAAEAQAKEEARARAAKLAAKGPKTFGRVTTRARAVEALERLVRDQQSLELSLADLGTKFPALTGGQKWGELGLGSARAFALASGVLAVNERGNITLAEQGADAAAPAAAAAPKAAGAPAAAAAAGAAGAKKQKQTRAPSVAAARDDDDDDEDAADKQKNERGCAPKGPSFCCKAMAFLSFAAIAGFAYLVAVTELPVE